MKQFSSLITLLFATQFAQAQPASYEYDKLQRLTKITNANGSMVTYQYDASGNRISQTTTIAPGVAIDVTIQNATLQTNSIQQGGSLTVSGQEANIGSTNAVGHYLQFYFSTNTTLDAADTKLDEVLIASLAANASSPFTNRVINVSNSFGIGNYFLLVVADGGNNLAETNETNNVMAIPFSVSTATSIIDPQGEQPIRFNPNPANQLLVLTGLGVNRQYNYSILDYTGRLLLNGTIQNTTQHQINTSNLPAGTYMLRLYNTQQNKLLGAEKIVVAH